MRIRIDPSNTSIHPFPSIQHGRCRYSYYYPGQRYITWLTLPRAGTSKSEESEGCVQGPAQIYKKICWICVRISSSRLVCSECRAGLDPPLFYSTPILLHTLPWLRPIRAQHMHNQQPTVGMKRWAATSRKVSTSTGAYSRPYW
jgi:hypothetical protein